MASTVQKILDSELPRPTWSFRPSLAAPIRSDMTFTRPDVDNPDPTARTLDPRSGLYEGRSADTPRIYGSQQSLLVEAAQRTNRHPYSNDYTNWSTNGNTTNVVGSVVDSIIEGEDAYPITDQSDGGWSIQNGGGTFSSSEEVFYAIIEKDSADKVQVRVQENNNFNAVGAVDYSFSSGIQNKVAGIEAHERVLSTSGPNSGKLVQLIVRYDPSAGTDYSGVEAKSQFRADIEGNGGTTILHHWQLEEAPNASSPIVTGSSATRGADNVTIFSGGQPEWWNPNEGTFFLEFTPRVYNRSENADQFALLGPWAGATFLRITKMGNSSPWNIDVLDDGSTQASVNSSANPFTTFKAAVSVLSGTVRLAVDGTTDENTSASTSNLLSPTDFPLGNANSVIGEYGRIMYTPQALPATEADRSAGDPISLETLTS